MLLILLDYAFLFSCLVLIIFYLWISVRVIGPTEVGLVMKRFAFRKLKDDNPIAFHGEAGYQADLLIAGRRGKVSPCEMPRVRT